MKFWGYKHTSGTHHVRRFIEPTGEAVVADAHSSPFAAIVIDPFDAHDIADARSTLKRLVAEAEAEA